MDDLAQSDWQFIAYAVQDRFDKLRPGEGEPKRSKDAKAEEERIMGFILRKAYPKT